MRFKNGVFGLMTREPMEAWDNAVDLQGRTGLRGCPEAHLGLTSEGSKGISFAHIPLQQASTASQEEDPSNVQLLPNASKSGGILIPPTTRRAFKKATTRCIPKRKDASFESHQSEAISRALDGNHS